MAGPIYTTVESVKVRLANKVQFQADPKEAVDGELPNELLCQMIVDAETMVEQDLRGRYAIPFRSISKGSFGGLPDHTKRALRTVVDWRAVLVILSTDFGRGSHISADPYIESQQKLYDLEIQRLLGQDREGEKRTSEGRFRFSPPLDDLLLAPGNREADDGYRGRIINTNGDQRTAESYAATQINNPGQSWIRRRGWGGL
jgi:hypothetical protein